MNKRKQKLEIKAEELFPMERDPLMDYDVTSDWFSSSNNSDLDIPPNAIYDDFLNLLDLPLHFEDEPLSHENKEIFQELCCTSTPKSSRPSVSKVFNDSGIDELGVKKIKKESDNSYHVLQDITSKINSFNNSNFTNLSHLSDLSKSHDISSEASFKKHVNILRKDFVLQNKNKSTDYSSSITKEQMVYYTGIKNYDLAIAILKHIKMPKCEVSGFKMELMALMKLRLDLPWLDMSFRFSISENVLKKTIKKAYDIMSYSLEDLLPWHSQRKISRRTVSRTYYIYSLISGESSHILILLTDSKKPVLFVSQNYDTKISALSVILNRCSAFLIPGDVVCNTDANGINVFYTINNQHQALFLNSPSPNNYSVIEKCHLFMTELLSEFTFLTKQNSSFELSKLARVASAIVNINAVSEISLSQLQKMYEKSSRLNNYIFHRH